VLTPIDVGMLGTATVDFGSPPSGYNTVAAIIGIETGADGVFQIPLFRLPTDATLLVPKLAAFPGSTYRLTGVSNTGMSATAAESIVLRRGLTGMTLAAGMWLTAPTSTMVSRTGASWAPVTGATVHSVEFTQGTAKLLNVTVFDASTQFTVPDLVALPSGAITAKVNAIGAPGLDVMNLSLDADKNKLVMVSSQPVLLN
jgi:hypothetical protein